MNFISKLDFKNFKLFCKIGKTIMLNLMSIYLNIFFFVQEAYNISTFNKRESFDLNSGTPESYPTK